MLWTLGLACTLAAACPCPPGTHCPGEGEQGCINCPTGTYQDTQTSGIFCIDCRISCGKREVKKEDCSAISNMICECMKGYFKPAGHNGLCLPHKPCPPGQGVKTAGLYSKNTGIMSDSRPLYRPFVKSAYPKIFCLFLNQNISCGYLKEPSQ